MSLTDQDCERIWKTLDTHSGKLDLLGTDLSEIGKQIAVILERSENLARKGDVTESIRLHLLDCKASRAPAAVADAEEHAARTKVWLALAGAITTAATVAAVYFGVSAQ